MANEDYLTQCLLTMQATLEASMYFTPTDGAPVIPVVVEVNQDIAQAIQMVQMRGILVLIAMESTSAIGEIIKKKRNICKNKMRKNEAKK